MPTITLKNIPADLHRELKKRAEEHHRSLNKEIIATLKMTTEDGRAFDPADLEASVRRARALIRRMRKIENGLRGHQRHLLSLHGLAALKKCRRSLGKRF